MLSVLQTLYWVYPIHILGMFIVDANEAFFLVTDMLWFYGSIKLILNAKVVRKELFEMVGKRN